MKNFRTPISLTMLVVAFSFTAAFGQTQKAAEKKADVKVEQITPQEENAAVPVEKKDLPVINDAIINIKEQEQYVEQKKKEQEKNEGDKKEVVQPK